MAAICDPVTGICVAPPTVSCVPPMLFRNGACECPDGGRAIGLGLGTPICLPAPPAAVVSGCVVTISYSTNDPNDLQVTRPLDPGCDAAGLELAVAVALARLLVGR
jgi:hypothetical protein